jgi:hypothetical protein
MPDDRRASRNRAGVARALSDERVPAELLASAARSSWGEPRRVRWPLACDPVNGIGRACLGLVVALSIISLASCGGSSGRAGTPPTTVDRLDCTHVGTSDEGPPVEGSGRLLTVDDVISVTGFEDACPRLVVAGGKSTQGSEGACGAEIPVPLMSQETSAQIGQTDFGAGLDEWLGAVDGTEGAKFIAAMGADIRPGCPPHASSGSPRASITSLADVVPVEGLPGSSVGFTATVVLHLTLGPGAPTASVPTVQMTDGVVAILHGHELLLIQAHTAGLLGAANMRTLAERAVARLNWT